MNEAKLHNFISEQSIKNERKAFFVFIVGVESENRDLLLNQISWYIDKNMPSWKDEELTSFITGMWDADSKKCNEENFSLSAVKKFLQRDKFRVHHHNNPHAGHLNAARHDRNASSDPDDSPDNSHHSKTSSVTSESNHAVKKAMASFVPGTLLSFLRKQGTDYIASLRCASFFMNVYVLLVDISGFTKLSGSFCKMGKSGIDDLQKATNGYMGQLVQVIYNHGGDIINFAGDAIIAIFPADAKSKEYIESTTTTTSTGLDAGADFGTPVVACGLLLKDMVYESSLTVHVAISCGEICFGILGGFDKQYECLISGECIFEISQCLDDAPSGHCVVTKKVVASLALTAESGSAAEKEDHSTAPTIHTHELPSGNFRVSAPAPKVRLWHTRSVNLSHCLLSLLSRITYSTI